ncbi:HlyD family efflux transporter periplasmic adaptor subunit [Sphingomonas changnyeongensis]|uniref:HlyD family efflux transporter periplasmic adaptor subunit n=1 Tax=Sphingomonas changnyeongensis TaxID=2698679 RepID=A0A7Z2NX22_9SPHN|nr:HlyD family efflux transporter periplasmic adaptor subunit [Sphingomonas changnyeongensis]QHL91401.1 HlyD family efflux transporter periplasmic adaptor subunit [Sphingomonas changnyeongensis]
MPFRAEHMSHFTTLSGIGVPRPMRNLAIMLMITIVGSIIFMLTVPWVQTAQGVGTVIALDPRDRVQNITALVPGRVERWFVKDAQLVKKGDPIVQIVDNDPMLLDRIRAERRQAEAEIAAAQQAMRVAQLDVNRMGQLYREGLMARRDYELAQIKVADYQAKIAEKQASINGIDIKLNRQAVQIVRAPRDGRVMKILGADNATMVKAGEVLATFAVENSPRVVELYIDGRDVPLVRPGRRVRLEFEGWPAIQFSGWPSVAQGMFDGRVFALDVNASPNGLFRVLVEEAPDRRPWPREPFVRLGAKVRGWVMMDTVKVGFELWRLLNDFPLQFQRPGDNIMDVARGTSEEADEAK